MPEELKPDTISKSFFFKRDGFSVEAQCWWMMGEENLYDRETHPVGPVHWTAYIIPIEDAFQKWLLKLKDDYPLSMQEINNTVKSLFPGYRFLSDEKIGCDFSTYWAPPEVIPEIYDATYNNTTIPPIVLRTVSNMIEEATRINAELCEKEEKEY